MDDYMADEEDHAVAFSPEEMLPIIYEVIWYKSSLSLEKKTILWTRVLVQLATIARGSDISWEKGAHYCPLVKNIQFPKDKRNYREDGLPLWIVLVWTDWKGRPVRHGKSPYKVRVCANPANARYCPITWLLRTLSMRRDKQGMTTAEFLNGPILPPVTAATYRNHLKAMFRLAGVPQYSSHSFRRSGAQWAARCGLDVNMIKDIGRWCDLAMVERYIAEGTAYAQQRMDDLGATTDPVLEFWIFDQRTKYDSMHMHSTQISGLIAAR
jgi:hypothetical protein